jgi:hypothetical protein
LSQAVQHENIKTQLKLKNINEKIKITQKKRTGKHKENMERSETNRFLDIFL